MVQNESFGKMFAISFAFHALLILFFFLKNQPLDLLSSKSIAIEMGGYDMKFNSSEGEKLSPSKSNPEESVKRFFEENLPFAPDKKINDSTPMKSYEDIKKEKQAELEKKLDEASDQDNFRTTPVRRHSSGNLLNENDQTGAKNIKGSDTGSGANNNTGNSGPGDTGKSSGGVEPGINMDNPGRQIVSYPVKPDYPQWALDQNVQGNVQIKIYIDKDGFVVGADIVQSSGNNLLDVLAKNYALKYRFEPISADREETARVRLNFTISKSSP